ncbi:MAG: response regulator [Elusimicrobiota bacterium]
MKYITEEIGIDKKTEVSNDILIVEDSPDIRTYLSQLLESKGYNTDTAGTAQKAIEKFRNNLYGVIILDYKLPDKNGDYVLEKINKINPISQTIVITGYEDYDITVEVIQKGAADYYRKPLKKQKILSSVNKAFNIYKSMHITTGRFEILFFGEEKEILDRLSKNINSQKFDLKVDGDKNKLFNRLRKGIIDVVILDFREEENLELLENINNLNVSVEVIVLGENEENNLPVNSIRCGATSFIRYPQDIDDINMFLNKAVNCLKLKRLNDFKLKEIKDSREIEVKITDARRIEVDVYKPEKTLSSSYALSLINNIPLGIGIVNKDFKIFYMNRYFETITPHKVPHKINKNFIGTLKRAGVKDINLKILKEEISRLFSREEDIETITLGEKEIFTLTSLKLITERGPLETVLMIIR